MSNEENSYMASFTEQKLNISLNTIKKLKEKIN
jgi:hypothetical protein